MVFLRRYEENSAAACNDKDSFLVSHHARTKQQEASSGPIGVYLNALDTLSAIQVDRVYLGNVTCYAQRSESDKTQAKLEVFRCASLLFSVTACHASGIEAALCSQKLTSPLCEYEVRQFAVLAMRRAGLGKGVGERYAMLE